MRYAVYNFIPGPYIPEDEPQVKQERPEEKMPLYYNVILPRYRGLAPLAEEYARRQRERNFFEDGGDKSGYNGLIYNPVEEWDYKQNNIGEVLYPSFEEWSNGNKYNAKAPDWMFKEGYTGPRTYGAVYDNFTSQIQQYNTERRLADRKVHPEKYIGDMHNYQNWLRHEAGLTSLGDNGVAKVIDSGVAGLLNIAGTVMRAPVEAAKGLYIPGYIPYYGSNNPYVQQASDWTDKGVGYAFSPFMLSNWIDWGSAGREGSHVKMPWQPNSKVNPNDPREDAPRTETPAIMQALDFAAMPFTMKPVGYAVKAAPKIPRFARGVADRYQGMRLAADYAAENGTKTAMETALNNWKGGAAAVGKPGTYLQNDGKVGFGEISPSGAFNEIATNGGIQTIDLHLGGSDTGISPGIMGRHSISATNEFVSGAPKNTVIGEAGPTMNYAEHYAGTKFNSLFDRVKNATTAVKDEFKGIKKSNPIW